MTAKDIMKIWEGESIANIDEFVMKMKSEDAHNLGVAKKMYVVYFVGTFLYGGLFVLSIMAGDGFWKAFSWFLFTLAFVVYVVVFRMSKTIYNRIDYSVSVIEMLRQARSRYRFRQPKVWLALLGVLFVDIGASINMSFHMEMGWSMWENIGVINLFLVPLFLGAFFFGWRKWKKRSKPIYDYASEVLKDAEP